MQIGALTYPAATVFGGVGMLFASRAHERAGELLYRDRLAGLARWTQALLVLAVTSFLAMFGAGAHAARGRSSGLGPTLAIGFGLLVLGSLIAVIVSHIMTLNEAKRVLGERFEKATP
jgi:hypothetical protein